MNRRARALSTGTVGALLLAGCGQGIDDTGSENGDDGEWPETILYGVLPTDDQDRLMAIYTPLEEYMAECLDHPFELYPGSNYTAMIEAMRTGTLHASKFGPFSYVLAHERANVEPMVAPIGEDGEPTYRSYIITLNDSGVGDLSDLEGESFAFVDPTSTSGYLFPRGLLIDELEITNDEVDDYLGDIAFSSGHDASIISVLNGDVTAAGISSNAWEHVGGGDYDDHDRVDDLKIVAETEDIPGTVEGVQGDLPEDLKEALSVCFEDAIDEPELLEFFDGDDSRGFVPIEDSDYDIVRDTADTLRVSPEELVEDEG